MPRPLAFALALVPFVVGVPVHAQDAAPLPLRPPGEHIAVSHGAGLAPTRDGDGLLGGGSAYRVRCTTAGLRFEPALGSGVATTQHVALRPVAVRRGELDVLTPGARVQPIAHGLVAEWRHADTIAERAEMRPDGAELSWRFEEPLPGSGDLVVRYACDTSLPPPRGDGGGLAFELPDGLGGVRIGGVTGIDANGRTTAGRVRWIEGALELSLPAAFVANASYPLVLDPTVGPIVSVQTNSNDDSEPDAAYDPTLEMWLVVWLRTFSAQDADIRGQRVNGAGAVIGNTIYFDSAGLAGRPRVASATELGMYFVTWAQSTSTLATVQLRGVDTDGTIPHSLVVTSTTPPYQLANADISCKRGPWAQQEGIFVAYHGTGPDSSTVYVHRAGFYQGALWPQQSFPWTWMDWTEFSLARSFGADNSIVAVGKRSDLAGQHLFATRIDSTAPNWLGSPESALYSGTGITFVGSPDVDGCDGHWVATWRRNDGLSGSNDSVMATSIAHGATAGELVHGAITTIAAGTSSSSSTAPAVGWSPAKTWVAYRRFTMQSFPSISLRATGVDSGSCVACNDTFVAPGFAGGRIVVVTAAACGATTRDDALAVWAAGGDIFAQRLSNHGNGGTIAQLGGACGNGGTQSFDHNPAIGSTLRCTITGLPLGATWTTFNMTSPTTPIVCGTCEWLPYAATMTPTITAGSAWTPLPIPCQAGLVGTVLQTQWTTAVAGQSPCAMMPGLVFSGRVQMTIGQ